ncbi:MAG: double-strand break repair helicase AddA, partial [Methylocapsa sp.]|nr:double-strand break repair helicase AddA [Methylocapsa sp.]
RDDLADRLRRALGLRENRDVRAIEREIAGGGISPERWSNISDAVELGTANDKKCAAKFRQALSFYQLLVSGGSFRTFLDSYRSIFFTKEGTPRVSFLTKAHAAKHPDLEEELRAEQIRLQKLCAERIAAATLERTRSLITIASAISDRYAAEKASRGILDFRDLIAKALALLEHSDARWVLYKLDSGIDHILVDEAQDTSKEQWRILEILTGDFASGEGSGLADRTFFAVGDEKQSIFSFQGAAPKMFDEMRCSFEKRFHAASKKFAPVRLTLSFRSVPAILSAVDTIFEQSKDQTSGLVAPGGEWMKHESLKQELPGLVEIWPLAKAAKDEGPAGWGIPQDLPDSQDPANTIAWRVAQKINELLTTGFVHEGKPVRRRRMRPGDILILVRKRGPFFEAMIRALKKSGIPAAGADRLNLTQHIAVMDLVAAGRSALLPQDDLTLACVLKSPLIGLDDDDLLALAPDRRGALFDALNESTAPKHTAAAAKIALWSARAGGGPFAFYAALLGTDGGRRGIEARLGLEACDAADEFLRLAIAYEHANAPSLCSFLNSLEGLEYEVKRDMETGADMVRVMTIHGAKGLEAKTVFLPDCCSTPTANHAPRLFLLPTGVQGEEAIAWPPKKELDCAAVSAAREAWWKAAWDEYRRQLYVALTRAEERLYIAGFNGAKGPDPQCWLNMIEAVFGSDRGFTEVPAFWNSEETVRRFVSPGNGAPAPVSLPEGEASAKRLAVPDWLFRGAPAGESAAMTLAPSRALGSAGRVREERRRLLRRGRVMHVLLQYLPAVAPGKRESAAGAFLLVRASFLDETARQSLIADALALIGLPELAPVFGPGSRAEILVAGKAQIGARQIDVQGKVDRIGETESEILLTDYKTGKPCPLEAVPKDYLAQMALYRALLAPLWPNKKVRAALIWTEGPAIVWLPDEMLDAALAGLGGQ